MPKINTAKRYEDDPHILVVDDDERIRNLVCRYLGERGFICLPAVDGVEAIDMLSAYDVDAVVLDVMMPGKTGVDVTRELRAAGKRLRDLPIIMLTAMGEAKDRIGGFEAGADDYLPKPFEPEELVMRLRALLRRAPKRADKEPRYRIGPWVFDAQDKMLTRDGENVALTDMEVQLLRVLGGYAGQAVSREELSEGCGVQAGERTVDVQITRLRKKIESDTKSPQYLQTVRGKGYLLRAEVIS